MYVCNLNIRMCYADYCSFAVIYDVLLTTASGSCKQIQHMAGSRQPQQYGLFVRMLRSFGLRAMRRKNAPLLTACWDAVSSHSTQSECTRLPGGPALFCYLCCLQSAVWQSRLSRFSHSQVPQSFSDSLLLRHGRHIWSLSSYISALKSDSTDNTLPMPVPRLSAGCKDSRFLPMRHRRLRLRSPCSRLRRSNPGGLSAKSASRRRSPVAWPCSHHFHPHNTEREGGMKR